MTPHQFTALDLSLRSGAVFLIAGCATVSDRRECDAVCVCLSTRPLAQYGGTWEYLLADALGSVRQIVDANGNVTLAESYEPYGSVLSSNGTASSIFGYAGEQIDTYIKLLFLRARY